MSVDAAIQLAHEVREWVDRIAPGETALGDRTVLVALTTYVGGATVLEADAAARRYLMGRVAHPSWPVDAGSRPGRSVDDGLDDGLDGAEDGHVAPVIPIGRARTGGVRMTGYRDRVIR